jgi:hypothetical protein
MKKLSILLIFIITGFHSTTIIAIDINPYFKDFFLMDSLALTKNKLKTYKTFFQEENIHTFKMDFPLFLYLDTLLKDKNLDFDFEKERIYLDKVHFFDFKNIMLQKTSYDFFYEKSFYYMVLKDIVSYPVAYPTRINPNLTYLKLKFFKNQLYGIEYQAKLKSYEMAIYQKNIRENLGVNLNQLDNKFSNQKGIYFIKVNPKKQTIRFNVMSKPIYDQIQLHIEKQIDDVLNFIVKDIEHKFEVAFNVQSLLLQERKRILKETLRKIYAHVNEL